MKRGLDPEPHALAEFLGGSAERRGLAEQDPLFGYPGRNRLDGFAYFRNGTVNDTTLFVLHAIVPGAAHQDK